MLRRQKIFISRWLSWPLRTFLQNIDSLPLSLYIFLSNLQVSDAQEAGAPSGGRASEEQVPDEAAQYPRGAFGSFASFWALHFLDFPVQMNLAMKLAGPSFVVEELLLECIWNKHTG